MDQILPIFDHLPPLRGQLWTSYLLPKYPLFTWPNVFILTTYLPIFVHIVIEWPLFTSTSVTILCFFLQDLSALIIPAALKPPSKPWMGFKLEWSDSKYNLRGRKRPADPTREKREGSRKKRNEKKKSPQAKVKTEHSVRIWSVTFQKST